MTLKMHCCFYCGLPLAPRHWTRLKFLSLFGFEKGAYGSAKTRRRAMTTKEHLVRKADGGKNEGNIVLAHAYCNGSRGERSIDDQYIRMRLLVLLDRHPLMPMQGT